ncbi:hypothetical protein D3C77_251550 [compost metagenome]
MAQDVGGIDFIEVQLALQPGGVAVAGVQFRLGRQSALGQHPAADHVAHQLQIGVGARQHVGGARRIGLGVQQPQGGVFDSLDGHSESFNRLADIEAVDLGQGRRHLGDESLGRFAAVHRQLAADQIHGLDAVGAFVDRGDAGVAIILSRAGLLDEAHAAVHLNAHRGDLAADVGGPGLGDGGEQVLAALPDLALFLGGGVAGQVSGDAGRQADGAGGGDLGLHHRQHTAHVGVIEDRGAGLASPDAAALAAFQRIGQGVLIGAFGDADALDADGQAGGVHHHEHMGQPLVRLADQFGAGALVAHDAGGRGVDAQLVLDADRAEGVALAQRAVSVHRELGRQEQADALGAGRRVG